MPTRSKRILLVDLDDARGRSRIALFKQAGYEVALRSDYISAENFDNEGSFDLVILPLQNQPELAIEYSNQLSKNKPRLPILLLADQGASIPEGTLSPNLSTGNPRELMKEIAAMLGGSDPIRGNRA
jgi:DNA-binding NtrC family response regulator